MKSIRLRSASIMAILGAVLASGCGGSTYLEDLKQPVLCWEQRLGMCSRLVAVDANRMVWNNQGCEDGRYTLDRVGAATQDRYSSLMTASTLLLEPPDSMPECHTASMHAFGLMDEGHRDAWGACGSGALYGDLDGLEEPFLSLAMAFKNLL